MCSRVPTKRHFVKGFREEKCFGLLIYIFICICSNKLIRSKFNIVEMSGHIT